MIKQCAKLCAQEQLESVCVWWMPGILRGSGKGAMDHMWMDGWVPVCTALMNTFS